MGVSGQEPCVRCDEYDGPELCLCEVCSDDFFNEYDREGQDIKREGTARNRWYQLARS